MPSTTGKVWRFGDHIDTDAMIPGQYLVLGNNWQALAEHTMEAIHPRFTAEAVPGDIVVAGRNFGCGSSRPGAAVLQAKGIACVIAASFSRLFLRNGLGAGLPLMECPEAAAAVNEGDQVEVDWETGRIVNHTTGATYQARPFPPFLQQLIRAGGIAPYLRQRLAEQEAR